jgi:hypothetical protein
MLLIAASLPVFATGSALDACRSIASDSERLACYDAIADRSPSAQEPSAAISAESLFGRDAAQTSAALQQQTGITPPQSLDTEIISIKARADKKLLISLQNGQQWEQIDGRPLHLVPGDPIRIRQAAFGSWLLYKQSGGHSIRVRRTD